MQIYSIYKITNKITDKSYIGWTSRDPLIRFKEHSNPSDKSEQIIHTAIKKYGVEQFIFEVIYQSLDYEHSRIMEGNFISEYKSLIDQSGYNVELGGTGHHRSQQTIEKHRAKMIGRKQSEEHKLKRSNAIRGENNGMFGMCGINHPTYGFKHSDECKLKMSNSRKLGIAERKANGTYVKPNTISNESIAKIKETKLQQKLDGKLQKFKNVKIQDPNGIIHDLGIFYGEFLIKHNLNNFMSKSIKDRNISIKGFKLIEYELNK